MRNFHFMSMKFLSNIFRKIYEICMKFLSSILKISIKMSIVYDINNIFTYIYYVSNNTYKYINIYMYVKYLKYL